MVLGGVVAQVINGLAAHNKLDAVTLCAYWYRLTDYCVYVIIHCGEQRVEKAAV